MKLKELKSKSPENWFTLKPIAEPKENQVFVRDCYDRTTKKYICHRWSDINDERLISGEKEVYTDFVF